ncbi:hypothetical protein P0D73_45885 [Paraburkholderia sp. RL18-101-BIB-B]|uniref:hypothetical protein n=1 Tax=Paraburkholderia sp. RL18-101-BIB-B TaxID=3031634 RepID=UPI0038B93718
MPLTLASIGTWLKDTIGSDTAGNIATVAAACFTAYTVYISVTALSQTISVNLADDRDKTFANVVTAVKDVAVDPNQGKQLFLALHAAARNIHSNLMTEEDAHYLYSYLDSERSLKGNTTLCESWDQAKTEYKPSTELESLVKHTLDCDRRPQRGG